MKICVASNNPVKVSAALKGFEEMFTDISFETCTVNAPSEVPDQPIGYEETLLGAKNRANNAQKLYPNADFWIGIEGGNIWHDTEMEAMAWVYIIDKAGKIGKARTAGFFLAPKTIALIKQGYELGHADELIFGEKNTKQKMGSTGVLTDNVMSRTRFYVHAVILALIPFKKPELFDTNPTS